MFVGLAVQAIKKLIASIIYNKYEVLLLWPRLFIFLKFNLF